MAERAEEILTDLMSDLATTPSSSEQASALWQRAAGALEALRLAGLLDEAGAAEWRSRLDEAFHGCIRPDDMARSRADDYLKERVGHLGLLREREVSSGFDHSVLLMAQVEGAIDAFYTAGLLYDRQRLDWLERAQSAGKPAAPDRCRGADSVSPARVPARAELATRAPRERLLGPPFQGLALNKVLVVDAALCDEVTVVTVELYEDGVVVTSRWMDDKAARPPVGLVLSDTDGRLFRHLAGHGSRMGPTMRQYDVYIPAVPADATELFISHHSRGLRVSLPSS